MCAISKKQLLLTPNSHKILYKTMIFSKTTKNRNSYACILRLVNDEGTNMYTISTKYYGKLRRIHKALNSLKTDKCSLNSYL